jgi:hypothetical protein
MAGGLVGGIIVVALLGFFAWAIASSCQPPKVDPVTGATVLHYSWVIRGLGLLGGVGMPLLIAVLIVVLPKNNPSDPLIAAALAGFFLLLGFPLLVETMCVRVDVSEDGIRKASPWHSAREFHWDEIKEVRYSQAWSSFIFVGPRRKKIRVPMLTIGIGDLADAVYRNLDRDQYAEAEKGLEILERWGMRGRR